MAGEFVRLTGVDDLKAALRALPRQMRTKVLRGALRSAAKVIQTEARSRAPVLKEPTPRRIRGTVRRSIVVRPSKIARRRGDVGVFVTVKASKSRLKKDARNDPYYFKFLEMGWIPRGRGKALRGGDRAKQAIRLRDASRTIQMPFLGPALRAKSMAAIQAFQGAVRPQIAKLNRRK